MGGKKDFSPPPSSLAKAVHSLDSEKSHGQFIPGLLVPDIPRKQDFTDTCSVDQLSIVPPPKAPKGSDMHSVQDMCEGNRTWNSPASAIPPEASTSGLAEPQEKMSTLLDPADSIGYAQVNNSKREATEAAHNPSLPLNLLQASSLQDVENASQSSGSSVASLLHGQSHNMYSPVNDKF
jgi:hypothetical protein